MTDRIIETPEQPNVTIIKEGRSGGGGGIIVALIALVVIAAVAFWAINSQKAVDPSDASVAAAAEKVGGAAEKIGNAAEDAVKKID